VLLTDIIFCRCSKTDIPRGFPFILRPTGQKSHSLLHPAAANNYLRTAYVFIFWKVTDIDTSTNSLISSRTSSFQSLLSLSKDFTKTETYQQRSCIVLIELCKYCIHSFSFIKSSCLDQRAFLLLLVVVAAVYCTATDDG
jgi:hypothetical protein